MKNIHRFVIPALTFLLLLSAYLVTLKPVFLHRNGEWVRVLTHASSVAMVLREAGMEMEGSAQPTPGLSSPVSWGMIIEVPSGKAIPILVRGEICYVSFPEGDGTSLRALLGLAGINLAEGEWVFADGVAFPPDTVLTASPHKIEVRTAVEFLLLEDGKTTRYSAPGPTVGEALWQSGITLYAADQITPPSATELDSIGQSPIVIEIVRSRLVTIQVDGREITTRTAGKTVGQALARAGFALTGLDYSVPAEGDSLPADGAIRIIRVREEILREQSQIAFKLETQPEANLELDQTRVIQTGAYGILESVMRVRFEDGVEVSRTSEGRHVLLEPQIRIVGYGTKVVIHTAATADTTIEYYRKIQVFATSYHPCGLGIVGNPNACSYTTRSGHAVEKGVIAMVASWYLLFQGDPVYVDGYGPATVEDSGVGPNAPYWIDLAYPSREEYVGWHRMTTLYFLTPVPANVPWILP
jgi:uncharacterized protein YabE (DUF348 family)